jgi:hypothetical protein
MLKEGHRVLERALADRAKAEEDHATATAAVEQKSKKAAGGGGVCVV